MTLLLALAAATLLAQSPLRLHESVILDTPQQLGGEAYRILAPADWTVEGGIVWSTAIASPAAPWVRARGPAGQEIGALPPLLYVWNDQLIGPFFPPGTLYAGTEVRPPVSDPFECIEQVIIPRFLRHLRGAAIVKRELLPDLVEASRPDWPVPGTRLQAGKVRLAYTDRGAPMEEDIYVVLVATQFRVGPTVSTIWIPNLIRYSKAPRGMLDDQMPLFQTMMFSFRPELYWWSKLQRVERGNLFRQMMQKNTSVDWWWQENSAFTRMHDATRSVARYGDRVDAADMQRYRDRIVSQDRINAHWDRRGMHVDQYRNPATGDEVELPSGYASAWQNRDGDYVVSHDSNGPSDRSDGSWIRLERSSRGVR